MASRVNAAQGGQLGGLSLNPLVALRDLPNGNEIRFGHLIYILKAKSGMKIRFLRDYTTHIRIKILFSVRKLITSEGQTPRENGGYRFTFSTEW